MQAVNKEAIHTLVVAYGQREAARRSGLNPNTVMAWCRRYGWKQAQRGDNGSHAICTQSSGDALAQALSEDSNASKIGFSRAARKVAEHAANLEAPGIYKRARAIKDIAAVAGQVHGWNSEQRQSGILNLNVLAGGKAAVQIVQREQEQG